MFCSVLYTQGAKTNLIILQEAHIAKNLLLVTGLIVDKKYCDCNDINWVIVLRLVANRFENLS